MTPKWAIEAISKGTFVVEALAKIEKLEQEKRAAYEIKRQSGEVKENSVKD